jgi:hypothetical protein
MSRARIAANAKSLEIRERVEARATLCTRDRPDLPSTRVRVQRSDLDAEVLRGGARIDPARVFDATPACFEVDRSRGRPTSRASDF